MVLDGPAEKPRRLGDISPQNPYYVNNMIIGELGDEEILLAACDGGDVFGWRISAIYQSILRNTVSFNSFMLI